MGAFLLFYLHLCKIFCTFGRRLALQFPRKYVRVFIKMREVLGKIRTAPSSAAILYILM